jgi:hypothetical protein
MSKLPSFGRLAPNILYAHGYTGHSIALSTMAGQVLAECVAGTAERFDFLSSIPRRRFPGVAYFTAQFSAWASCTLGSQINSEADPQKRKLENRYTVLEIFELNPESN